MIFEALGPIVERTGWRIRVGRPGYSFAVYKVKWRRWARVKKFVKKCKET